MEAEGEPGWPDLPSDILDLVHRRLPSLADSIRLAAVCRRIRSSIKLLPPHPHLPWILLDDGTLFDLSSNVPVHQVRLPGDASCYSAGENMLFVLHHDGRCSLMNALSGDTTQLPELAAVLRKYMFQSREPLNQFLRKAVMSKSSPHHGPIIALLVGDTAVILSTCRPAGEINSCPIALITAQINDMAFSQGRLYALCGHYYGKRLIAFELDGGRFDKPTPPGDKPVYIAGITVVDGELDDRANGMVKYLVESDGNLLLVILGIEYTYSGPHGLQETKRCILEVQEADMSERRWKKADRGLDGHALFVSFPCSMSWPAAADSFHGAREGSICFLHRDVYDVAAAGVDGGAPGYGVYDMRTKMFTPLPQGLTPLLRELTPPVERDFVGGGFRVKANSLWFPAWFSPNNNATLTGGGTHGKGEVELTETLRTEASGEKSWRTTCTAFFSSPKMNYSWVPRWICKKDSID